MANEMAIQISSFGDQKAQEDEECLENIPPAFTLSETCPATLSSNQNDKGKPRLSGLQSALTPILKYLSIGNKSTSLPVFSFNNGTAKSNESVSVLTLGDKDNPAGSVLNENLPEITLLDVTCDSTMNMTRNTQCDSTPSTPVFTNKLKKPGQLCPTLTPICWLHDEILPEMTLLDDTCDTTVHLTRHGSVHSDGVPGTPTCETPIKPAEMILGINPNSKLSSTLTPKNDTSSVTSEKETPSVENTHDCTPKKRPSSETSEIILAKTERLEQCSQEKMSTTFTGNLTHSINSSIGESDGKVEDVKKVQLQVTQDISMSSTLDSSKTSSENSTQNMDKTQPAVESHPVNITRDLSSSSDMSVQCERSQSLESNSKNVTSELQVGPVKTFCPEEETSRNSDITTTGTNKSTAGSLNSTFTTVQGPSSASSCVSNLQNRTLDLPTSNSGSPPMTEAQKTNVSTKLSPETFLVLNDSCSDSKSSQSCEMQNQTFEKNSLLKTNGSTILVQAGTTIKCLQNTFENKPNGIINYTVSDKSQDTTQEKTSSQVNNTTTKTLPEMSGDKIQATTDPNVKPAEPPKSTFNVNPAVEEISGASGSSGEAKDSLNNGHLLCDSIIHHNTFTESHKANTFSLDNTFDFKSDPLVTSTPMHTSKAFSFTVEREEGKTAAAQKKLYVKGPCKPGVQVMSEMPSNIVCDRKTFLPQPTTKQNLLTMKPPSLLSKFKPTSLLPKRPDLLTSGLPMTRQVEVVKNNAALLQQTTEISSSYNLRSTTAALKQPSSGIRKPPLSSIPSGIQRPGHGLKPPMTKTSASVSSGSDKPAEGTDPLVKSTQPNKKHPLTKTEALPAAKKKKMDTALTSGNVDAPVSTASKAKTLKPPTHSQRTLPAKTLKHDTAVPSTSSEISATCGLSSRVRTLKLPATSLRAPTSKPLCYGCANCSLLEEQLKLKDEEIKRLKEELLKCRKKNPTSL